MPFRSQAQRRKFYAMADRGEISDSTVQEWESHTPKGKDLPERVSKKKKKREKKADAPASLIGHLGQAAALEKTAIIGGVGGMTSAVAKAPWLRPLLKNLGIYGAPMAAAGIGGGYGLRSAFVPDEIATARRQGAEHAIRKENAVTMPAGSPGSSAVGWGGNLSMGRATSEVPPTSSVPRRGMPPRPGEIENAYGMATEFIKKMVEAAKAKESARPWYEKLNERVTESTGMSGPKLAALLAALGIGGYGAYRVLTDEDEDEEEY